MGITILQVATMEKQLADPFIRKVNEELYQLRIECEMTHEKAYKSTRINVARIENSDRDITLATLGRLCELYGLSISEFFRRLNKG